MSHVRLGFGAVESRGVVTNEPSLTTRNGSPKPVDKSRDIAAPTRLSCAAKRSPIEMLFRHAVSVAEQDNKPLK